MMRPSKGTDEVRVAEADDGPLARAFIELPYQLYASDRCWVPPLRSDERHRWSSRYNTSLRLREAQRWVALRGNQVVGRIAAIVDQGFSARWEPETGLFGFFECIDDRRVAEALLRTAERWLDARGLTRIIGPVNLTTHDETGILVDGFDSPPMVQSPYNPRYYAPLLEAAGYRRFREYDSYLWRPAQQPADLFKRHQAIERAGRRIQLRPMRPEAWDAEVRTVFRLYNAAFAPVWGFVPITWEEFQDRASSFRRFVRPDLLLFAEVNGQPVGFSLTLPDINRALQSIGGRLWPFGWARLLRMVPRIRAGRFILLGVDPESHGRGVGALLAAETATRLRALGYELAELSLVQTANDPVRRVIDLFGCPRFKTFRLYSRTI